MGFPDALGLDFAALAGMPGEAEAGNSCPPLDLLHALPSAGSAFAPDVRGVKPLSVQVSSDGSRNLAAAFTTDFDADEAAPAVASGANAVDAGSNAVASGASSAALRANSTTTRANTVSVAIAGAERKLPT